MSAASFGASLLDGVHEESLDQLLSDLRHRAEWQLRCSLGIPQLDWLVNLFHPQVQSGGTADDDSGHDYEQTLPGAASQRPIQSYTTFDGEAFSADIAVKRRKPVVIELGGSTPSTGKTQLLYYVTAASILPRSHHGQEATAVWFDLDITFSATRLNQVCLNYLDRHNYGTPVGASTSKHHNLIAQEALKHVHVFSISSSRQLLSILDTLPDYLLQTESGGRSRQGQQQQQQQQQQHHSIYRPLSLLILDSATAFYWTDRFDAEMARLESVKTSGPLNLAATDRHQYRRQQEQGQQHQVQGSGQMTSTATQILNRLRVIQTKFENVVIYTTKTHLTTTTITNTTLSAPSLSLSSTIPSSTATAFPIPVTVPAQAIHATNNNSNITTTTLLNPWRHHSTLSLTLSRLPVPRFASHMTLAECTRDRQKRYDAVRRNRIKVDVDEVWLRENLGRKGSSGIGSGGGESGGIATGTAPKGFVMRIGVDGIEIED